MTEDTRERDRLIANPRCPFCHEDVARGEALQVCSACHAFHHRSCWGELGGCAACGTGRVSPVRQALRAQTAAQRAQPRPPRARRWPKLLAILSLMALAGSFGAGVARLSQSAPPVATTTAPAKVGSGRTWRAGLALEEQPTDLFYGIRMRLPAGLDNASGRGSTAYYWGQDLKLEIAAGKRSELLARYHASGDSPAEAGIRRVTTPRRHEFTAVLTCKEGSLAVRLLSDTVPATTLEKLVRKSLATLEAPQSLGLVHHLPPPPPAPPLERIGLGDGFTVLADASVSVSLPPTRAALTDARDARTHEHVVDLEVADTLLPHRELHRDKLTHELVVVAQGQVDGASLALVAKTEDSGEPAADAAKLMAIADSFARAPFSMELEATPSKAFDRWDGDYLYLAPKGWELVRGDGTVRLRSPRGDVIQIDLSATPYAAAGDDRVAEVARPRGVALAAYAHAATGQRQADVAALARKVLATFELVPKTGLCQELPNGAGTVRLPEGWRGTSTGPSSFVGVSPRGDQIELVVSLESEPRFRDDADYVTTFEISPGRRVDVFAVCSPERRGVVAFLAKKCADTWQPAGQ